MGNAEMKAAVYQEPGRMVLEKRDVYSILDDELLLRVGASSICGTDLKIMRNGHFKIPAGVPRVLADLFPNLARR